MRSLLFTTNNILLITKTLMMTPWWAWVMAKRFRYFFRFLCNFLLLFYVNKIYCDKSWRHVGTDLLILYFLWQINKLKTELNWSSKCVSPIFLIILTNDTKYTNKLDRAKQNKYFRKKCRVTRMEGDNKNVYDSFSCTTYNGITSNR